MKILSLLAALITATTVHARSLHLHCEPLDPEQGFVLTADSKVLTKPGSRLVKVEGLAQRQTLLSSLSPINHTMQLTLRLPNGDTKSLIKVTSAEEAAQTWAQLRPEIRPASLLPTLMPAKVGEEYLRYISMKSASDVYLVLLSSEGDFGYAGFCNLKVR